MDACRLKPLLGDNPPHGVDGVGADHTEKEIEPGMRRARSVPRSLLCYFALPSPQSVPKAATQSEEEPARPR